MSDELVAIDLSHHNTVSDFQAVVDSGIVGVFHKATEGTGFVDNMYASRQAEALAVGLKWGAYHFLKHGSAGEQMAFFVANASLAWGSRVAIDYEDPDCTLVDLHDALEWLDTNAPDLQVAIYGGSLLKEQINGDYYGDLAQSALWLAHYTEGTPSWPKNTWPQWTLWQYTDSETVPGIDGPVDGNRFNGSRENCALWFGPVERAPAAPVVASATVKIEITAPEGVELEIVVNGTAR